MSNSVVEDLRQVADNARFQLSGMTPRHRRYAAYSKTVETAERAIDTIQLLEREISYLITGEEK